LLLSAAKITISKLANPGNKSSYKEMTPNEFRRIALKLDGATEGAHMGHPDFRANGRIFATLYPDGQNGMVKLTSEQQQDFISTDSDTFAPASGAWGRQGCTTVRLDSVAEDKLGEAMTLAWQNVVKVVPKPKTKRASKPAKRPGKR
jgi:predicted DNA-binding protein (MmcQ/YjbR family)